MQRERWEPKITDHENIEKAINLIYELMEMNQDIEPTLWCFAITFCLVNGFYQCGFTYEEFIEEHEKALEHYKNIFDVKI